MSSITQGCGGSSSYPVLRGLDAQPLAEARNIVLCVIDGLGYDYLVRRGAGSQLHQRLHRRLHAVAPPTTSASVTTFLTGVAPQQHGLTGWFMWLREVGSVVTVLPFLTRCNRADLTQAGITPQELIAQPPLFARLPVRSYSLMPDWLANSVFNRALLGNAELVLHKGMEDYFSRINTVVRAHAERKFLYAYWPYFDGLAHDHGVGSAQAAEHFARLDDGFAKLFADLAGTETVVLVTADHGFVDTRPETRLRVNDLPELQRCLAVPLCGEPRLAYCYVRRGMEQTFADYVRSELAHAVMLHRGDELIAQGLFGLGAPHPELHSRVGDYVLALKDDYILTQRLPGETPLHLVGHHGGLSAAEVEVPLVLACC
ncbi:MAG: alkaline phosphatase family protein [Pseudomonadota bacterium]